MSTATGEHSPHPAALFVLIKALCFRSHEAQECYCGEPACIGFIGGKTQTDIGIMDDLYLDGLSLR
jgi:hypothetical protein